MIYVRKTKASITGSVTAGHPILQRSGLRQHVTEGTGLIEVELREGLKVLNAASHSACEISPFITFCGLRVQEKLQTGICEVFGFFFMQSLLFFSLRL